MKRCISSHNMVKTSYRRAKKYMDKNIKINEAAKQDKKDEPQEVKEYGQVTLEKDSDRIHCLTIIGQVEGHVCLPQQNKTTKYEHVLPQLASIEESDDIDGLLLLLNTVGGDVEAGLAIAEMIASLSKPTVSIVLGGGHSIGVPLAVAAKYSFIVPSSTMTIHPVRMSGTVIGVPQTFEYFDKMQDRIVDFITRNSDITRDRIKELMLDTGQLAKDVGTIVVGEEAVKEGIINELGGIDKAIKKLYEMIEAFKAEKKQNSPEESDKPKDKEA